MNKKMIKKNLGNMAYALLEAAKDNSLPLDEISKKAVEDYCMLVKEGYTLVSPDEKQILKLYKEYIEEDIQEKENIISAMVKSNPEKFTDEWFNKKSRDFIAKHKQKSS